MHVAVPPPGGDPGGHGDARGRRRVRGGGGGGDDVLRGVRGVGRVRVVVGGAVLGRAGGGCPVGGGRGGRGARVRAGIRADALLPADAAPAQARGARLLRRLDLVVTRTPRPHHRPSRACGPSPSSAPDRPAARASSIERRMRCMHRQAESLPNGTSCVVRCMQLWSFSPSIKTPRRWLDQSRWHSDFLFPRTAAKNMCAPLSIHENPYSLCGVRVREPVDSGLGLDHGYVHNCICIC